MEPTFVLEKSFFRELSKMKFSLINAVFECTLVFYVFPTRMSSSTNFFCQFGECFGKTVKLTDFVFHLLYCIFYEHW